MANPNYNTYIVRLGGPEKNADSSSAVWPRCAQVYLASAAPPVRHPNVYGVDMPSRKEFVAHGLTEQQVRAWP